MVKRLQCPLLTSPLGLVHCLKHLVQVRSSWRRKHPSSTTKRYIRTPRRVGAWSIGHPESWWLSVRLGTWGKDERISAMEEFLRVPTRAEEELEEARMRYVEMKEVADQ